MKKDMVIVTGSKEKLHRGGGIRVATENLFANRFRIILIDDYSKRELKKICQEYSTVLFSGYDLSLEGTVKFLKNKGKKILVYWHFATSVLTGDKTHCKNWNSVMQLARDGFIDLMMFCKKSEKEAWKATSTVKHVPAYYIMNNVLDSNYIDVKKKDIVGVYSGSGTFWVKNGHTNIRAAAMFGMPVDITPISPDLKKYAENLGLNITGDDTLPHEEFLKRMSGCAIILYVTHTEACPMLVLEALMNGVLCLTGNNHDYFEGFPILQKYLIVERADDASCICRHMRDALNNREEIFAEFAKWKAKWDLLCEKNMEDFLQLAI